jgi:hypothetical protein
MLWDLVKHYDMLSQCKDEWKSSSLKISACGEKLYHNTGDAFSHGEVKENNNHLHLIMLMFWI